MPVQAPQSSTGGGAAAAVAQDYHRLIETRNYAAAWKLREPSDRSPTEQAFAAAYGRYAEYRATVGTASEPVSDGKWDYVEVPVQIYGRSKAGEPFASAGTMTLRRRAGSSRWRVAPR